jgi:hypothetical protein
VRDSISKKGETVFFHYPFLEDKTASFLRRAERKLFDSSLSKVSLLVFLHFPATPRDESYKALKWNKEADTERFLFEFQRIYCCVQTILLFIS